MQENTVENCQFKKGDFASATAEYHYRPNIQLEPIHQKINLTFNIKESYCKGSVIQRVRANTNTKISLKLNGINFTISEIKSYNESEKKDFKINWNYDGSIITISWIEEWLLNETRDVEIFYEVKKPIAGLYYSYPDNDHPNKPVYVGADHETERARYWLPCVDHPSIRTTLDFQLTSNSEHIILANGKLIDEKVDGTKKTAHWALDFPCPSYLITICIGDLVVYEDRDADAGKGPIHVKYFTTKNYTPNDLKLSFDRTPKMLEWMNKKLRIPLPYPKYYQYALPQHGGAMENISLVSWDDISVLDEIFAKENTWNVDQINVHEMAHSWFGDSVVIKDFAHAWLKESWATYMETVWLEETVSKEEADYDRFFNERRYKNETKRYVRPIVTNKYDSSWSLFDSHLYPGGSQRIDMLRKLLGDKIFWEAVTDYLQTFQGKIAETFDFQRKLETHSGLNLQKFFDQWYYGKGYPILKISYNYDSKNKFIELKIQQSQMDKEREIGLFEFELELSIEINENKFEDFVFTIKDEQHVFYIKADNTPKQILIDKENKILMDYEFNPGSEMLKKIYSFGSIKNKILSANELAKDGSIGTIDFLAEQYKKEQFWGLKNELVETIGSIYNNHAYNALLTFLDTEKNPLVLKELVKTVQNIPINEQVIEKIKKLLINNDILYLAYVNSLQTLGMYKEKKDEMFNFLKNYTPSVDKKKLLINGKRNAIGKLRSKASTQYLLEDLKRKDLTNSEIISLINALSESITWAEEKDQEQIKELFIDQIKLRENSQTLRALANALGKFNDPSLNSHLLKIKSKIPFQEYPLIDKIIEKNKGKSPNDEIKKLEERLTKLEKENLDLKEKISKFESILPKNLG